jgi:predicted TIM-barrel fold metal-dependent hydrolase
MMICDAQVHIWAADTPERPWPARHPPHREPLGKEELLGEMDRAGIDRAIIVPPSWEGDRNDLKQGVAMFTEEMPWLKGADLEGVMGRDVGDWPGWKACVGQEAIAVHSTMPRCISGRN